jgi:hypothetical protein
MRAKNPAKRYQSAAEVANVMRQWRVQHGRTVDSPVVSASSTQVISIGAGTRSSIGGPSSPSGVGSDISRPANMPPLPPVLSSNDTLSDLSHSTIIRGGSQVLGHSPSDSRVRAVKKLPRAKPLDDATASGYVLNGAGSDSSPRQVRELAPKQPEPPSRRTLPRWLWIGLAASAVFAGILALAMRWSPH